MMTRQYFGFKQTALVVALTAAFSAVHADEDEMNALTKPDAISVSVGAATIAADVKDRALFGQYSGWGNDSSGLLLDFDYVVRDEASGTWMTAEGRNLGLDTRELSVLRQKQGDWKLSADYNEQVRRDPRTFSSSVQGVGTTQPTVVGSALPNTDYNFEIKRKGLGLGFQKWISPNWQVEVSAKSENRDGTRLGGIGGYCIPGSTSYNCTAGLGALLAMPELVSSSTTQLEVKTTMSGKDYAVTAGYYGSFFKNNQGTMRFGSVSGLVDMAGASVVDASLSSLMAQPVALAPDNQAHQFYVNGNYRITPVVQATFNYAVTHATQDQSFASMGLAAAAGLPGSLQGVVDTTLAQLGLTARPIPKLTLNANLRLEDVDDKTPQALYGGTYSNATNSSNKANAKAEASYLYRNNIKVSFGVEYAGVKRSLPSPGNTIDIISPGSLTSVREKTNEVIYKAEVRSPVLENLNASLAYLQSERDGSRWIDLNTYQIVSNAAVYSATGAFPTTMMDRKRDKWRATADWAVNKKLSLQFTLEDGRDKYEAPTLAGMRSTGMTSAGVDATFAISDNWKASGYVNYSEQSIHVNHGAGYIATLHDTSNTVGMGVNGRLNKQWDVGADLSYMDERNAYGLASGNSLPAGTLPDVSFRVTALKLFGKYAMDKNSDIRVDLVHQAIAFNEWTWLYGGVPYAYSDNSTVSMQTNQNVTSLGVRYVYRFK